MSTVRTAFKSVLWLLLALLLIAGALVLWLRFEFARVKSDEADLARWLQVPVASLAGEREPALPCIEQYPHKRAFFGGLHVHTSASYDASSFGATTTVEQAYRFARGESLPLRYSDDPADYEAPELTISAPLDFLAVTDHAESLGETTLCQNPESESYPTLVCRIYRGDVQLPIESEFQSLVRLASMAIFGKDRSQRICGADGMRCLNQADLIWQENQRATEAHHDRSGNCAFTTFHGYEYTLAEEASNLHRNVIFSSDVVPQSPLSSKEARDPELLWAWLDAVCIEGDEQCDALAIPHNSNWSSGRMWFPYSNQNLTDEQRVQRAERRARLEPLAEIMQIKGDSECRNGIASVYGAADEFCDFEKLRPASEAMEDCDEEFGSGGMMLKGCASRYSYVRYALTAGLSEQDKLGVNPFKLGIVAASDTHIGAPIVGREKNYVGSHGNDREIEHRLLSKVEVPGGIATGSPVRFNPGGVAGIYAHENSRPALFNAMRDRETFGTSGPRIEPRFFAGWDMASDLCDREDYLEQAYASGVPMGADLPSSTSATADSPTFVVSAVRDSREGAGLLQRIQIIKGWVDDDGRTHQAVYDVAGDANNGAAVDANTCAVSGTGFNQLCSAWRDPDFEAGTAAVYYARVLENPSCRWSRYDCLSLPESERPDSCSDPDLPWKIQERAWTSPIWYTAAP